MRNSTGDRGIVDHRLFRLARDLGWGFRIHLKSSIYVGHAFHQGATVGELMPEKGHALFLYKIWITEKWFEPGIWRGAMSIPATAMKNGPF